MTSLNTIESEIADLPLNLRAEVLDFMQFVKQRHGLPSTRSNVAAVSDNGDSAFFQALESIDFIGCIDSDEQLSTTYKSRLDFSGKCGIQS